MSHLSWHWWIAVKGLVDVEVNVGFTLNGGVGDNWWWDSVWALVADPDASRVKVSYLDHRDSGLRWAYCVFQVQRSQDRAFQSVVTSAGKKYRSSLWSVRARTPTHTQTHLVKSYPHFQGEVEEICRTSGCHCVSAGSGNTGGPYWRGRLGPGLQEEEGGEGERHRRRGEEQETTRWPCQRGNEEIRDSCGHQRRPSQTGHLWSLKKPREPPEPMKAVLRSSCRSFLFLCSSVDFSRSHFNDNL